MKSTNLTINQRRMKRFVLVLFLLFFSFYSKAQNNIIDSLYKKLAAEKRDTGRAIILYNLSYYYQPYKPDSALLLAQNAYAISKKHHFLKGESKALGCIAGAFFTLDNYPKAIEYYINQLKIEETIAVPQNIGAVYINMALVYNSGKDTTKSLYYALLADSIVKRSPVNELTLYTYLNLGEIYEKANRLDSALMYTQRCYELATQQKNLLLTGLVLNNLGNIYYKKGDYKLSLSNYNRSLPYDESVQDYSALTECKLGLANIYEKAGNNDSAQLYARQVFMMATQNEFSNRALDASVLLVRIYKAEHKIDSAFAYQEIMIALKDSIDSKEKIRHLENITIEEQLRQKELAEIKQREAEDRKEKLQLLAIGIAIPIFFFISIYLSRKKVHRKVIEFSGSVSLLLLFEYILLLIHPFVADKTDHSPLLEIVIFVAIASLLTPTHHKIEQWLISRLSQMHEHHLQSRRDATKKNSGGK